MEETERFEKGLLPERLQDHWQRKGEERKTARKGEKERRKEREKLRKKKTGD